MKTLIVEDSERLRRALQAGLRRSGFVVDSAKDGAQALLFANAVDYDVIVLDLMLPKLDGFSVLKRLRQRQSHCRVLILSAKDQVEDRVTGLELGADDYLVKPFAFEELVARIKTLARRRHDIRTPEMEVGSIVLDISRRRVTANGQSLKLTPAEHNLLEHLVMRRGCVISKSQLQDALSNADSEAVSNVVEVLVSNLRKKIRAAGAANVIKTKRGFGYYVE